MEKFEVFIYPLLIFVCAGVLSWYIKFSESKKEKKMIGKSSDSKPSANMNDKGNDEETTQETVSDSSEGFQDNNDISSKNSVGKDMDNRELLLNALSELGCKADTSDKDNISFKFQGENFAVQFNKKFIRIWDLPFGKVNVLDTNLPLIIEGINSANFGFGPTILLRQPDEKGDQLISSKMDILFIPQIPFPEKYLAAVLNMFFDTKQNLQRELDNLVSQSQNSDESILTSASPYQN